MIESCRPLCAKLLILFLAAGLLTAQAQTAPVVDARHLLLDGSLTDAEVRSQPFVFNDLREAVRQLKDTTTLYIKPWVYWVDNPDVPDVVRGENGREPFGMVIRTKKLTLVGLGQRPHDVVLAAQRGQMQGAVGNFTMLDMHVDELTVENMTLGNYCNVDLDYPLRPELSRKKRSDAITQAHVGYVHGRRLTARKVRFISRLNLNPLNGARESLYDSCHFECTDDALNGGHAVYRHCDFDLYGAKPMWSTFGSGPLFYDCDFYVKTSNRETYFCKQGGPVTVVGCRYHAPEGSYVGWTAYPQRWLRCYQKDFSLNGQPYTIGSRQKENTLPAPLTVQGVLQSPHLSIPFLPISQHEAALRSPASLTLTSDSTVSWTVEPGFEPFVKTTPGQPGTAAFQMTNDSDEPADFCIIAKTADGREAVCQVVLQPSQLPPPTFLKEPEIRIENGVASLDYSLDLQGRRDESFIGWSRLDDDDCQKEVTLAWSNDGPQLSYKLRPGDVGRRVMATIRPAHQRSPQGDMTEVASRRITDKDITGEYGLETDFSDIRCGWSEGLAPDSWTVDGYKPLDTSDYTWSFDRQKPMWEYGEGYNGAVGKGLLQAQRGARLMYTPVTRTYNNMSLTLQVDPTKTAGQGFGSATGQYMDVCLKFDTRTLTGYGLRIIRTVKHAKAVDFLLVEYKDGVVTPLTDPVSATCYRTGCTIRLDYTDGELSAHVETKTPKPAGGDLPHKVDLKATVQPNTFGGIHIQHTGSCGESTTMLHHLDVNYSR